MGFFEWSKIFWAIFLPGNFLAWILVIGAVFSLAGQWRPLARIRKPGLWMMWFSATVFAVLLFVPVGSWLASPLENRFVRPAFPERADGILVLGGGEHPSLFATRGLATAFQDEGKFLAAVELARRYPNAKLVYSGGSGFLSPSNRLPETDAARAIWQQIGFDTGHVVFESRSRNTWENLVFSKAIVAPEQGEVWLLVTSAQHMPRTMGIANRVGWKFIAWPTDFMTTENDPGRAYEFGISNNLGEFENALHEWLGLLAYRLTGKTTRLFPAPGDPVGDDAPQK